MKFKEIKSSIRRFNKYFQTMYSIVTLIGVCCFAVGFGSICGYATGRVNFTSWYAGGPMPFSTSAVISLIGLALFIIGKNHLNDQSEGQA